VPREPHRIGEVELADASGAALRDGASLDPAASPVVTACVVRDPLETRIAIEVFVTRIFSRQDSALPRQ